MTKPVLRADALRLRAACAPERGHRLAGHVLAAGLVAPGAVVAGYHAMRGEIDIGPLLLALIGRGHDVLLPETPPKGHALTFRRWRPGTPMLPGRFGTQHPDAPIAVPTLLLVPLLAFDAACNRLGYGGGYYDRTIAGLPGVRTTGCGFAAQRVDAVPVLPHDAPLDAVATEAGIWLKPEP